MGDQAADGAMVQPDHPVAPDIGAGFAADPDIAVGIIGDQPGQLGADRAIAAVHPAGELRDFDRDRALDAVRDAEWQARDAQREVDMLRARFAAYYGGW